MTDEERKVLTKLLGDVGPVDFIISMSEVIRDTMPGDYANGLVSRVADKVLHCAVEVETMMGGPK